MNLPVALVALVLIFISKPVTDYKPAPIDYRGLVLIAAGVALSVFGFQQSNVWGWHNPLIGLSIAVGLALLVVFYFVILAGAGMGFMLGPSSTDAVNRASRLSYGEATGITQTVRNCAASMGLAILGTISVAHTRNHLFNSLVAQGAPAAKAHSSAEQFSSSGSGSGSLSSIPHFFRVDFAQSTQTVFYVMAGIMAAAVIGLIGLRAGVRTCSPICE